MMRDCPSSLCVVGNGNIRRTAASVAVGQGASLALIRRLLGHTQTQTTHRYTHVDVDPAIGVANVIGDAISGAIQAGLA
jgi:integrase